METLCRIRDIYRAIAEFEVKFMQEFDLSLNEGMLLCTLLNTPKLTSSEIAEALGLSASNASKIIRSVEEKKLITRLVGKADKRQMHFALTPEGKNRITVIKNSTPEIPALMQEIVFICAGRGVFCPVYSGRGFLAIIRDDTVRRSVSSWHGKAAPRR